MIESIFENLFTPNDPDDVAARREPVFRMMKEFEDELDANDRSEPSRPLWKIICDYEEADDSVYWMGFIKWLEGQRVPAWVGSEDYELFGAYDDWVEENRE